MIASHDETDGPSPARHASVDIAGYRVQRVIGEGSVATVYAATQAHPKRTVALKVLKPSAVSTETMRRFRREIETLGKLQHPNIAQVFDTGTCELGGVEVPYYVMEHVAGERDILDHVADRRLELPQRLRLFVKICSAVDFGHRHKVIHRRLRPRNILVDRAGEPKLIDFGIASARETGDRSAPDASCYVSPEQRTPAPVDLDLRCDVYALGMLLYRLATGQLPHETGSARPARTAPRKPSAIDPKLRGDLEAIIMKAIATERSDRYRTAGSLGRDVVRHLAGKPIHARGSGRVRLFLRRRRPALLAAAVVIMIAGAATGIVAWERLRPREAPRVGELERQDQERARLERMLAERATPAPLPVAPIELDGHTARVTVLAFDPAGTRLVSGSRDETFVLWDVDDGAALVTARDHDRAVRHLAFSPDGRLLLTAADDGSVLIVEIEGNTVRYGRRDACAPAPGLAVHFGEAGLAGARIAQACEDLTMQVREIESGAARTLRSSSGVFTAAAFTGDGRTLATGTVQGRVELRDVAAARRTDRVDLGAQVVALGFVDGGGDVVAATADGGVAWWRADPAAGTVPGRPESLGSRLDEIGSARFDPSGRWLICASSVALQIFDLERRTAHAPPVEYEETITAVAIDAQGRYAVGGTGGVVLLTAPVGEVGR